MYQISIVEPGGFDFDVPDRLRTKAIALRVARHLAKSETFAEYVAVYIDRIEADGSLTTVARLKIRDA